MVEKVSKSSNSIVIPGDSSQDDKALLNRIEKKKKQKSGEESAALAALLPQGSPIRLPPTFIQRGGLLKTEKQAVKEKIPAAANFATDILETPEGNSLRRRVALAIANQMASSQSDKKIVHAHNVDVSKVSNHKVSAEALKSERQAPAPENAVPATNAVTDIKSPQSTLAQPSSVSTSVNPVMVNQSGQETDTDRHNIYLRTKEDTGEVRPLLNVTTLTEGRVAKQPEAVPQSKNSSLTLQQNKTQTSLTSEIKGASKNETLEVRYQFQRWIGDHSVKVSLPTEARRDGNVILLPSDARAADVLQRNMGNLTGFNPDLLQPQQEKDEQQERRRPQQQDEDQE